MRAIVVLCLIASTADADATREWLDGLVDRVVTDLAAGKPLVVEVDVPLCDNHIIRCGNPKLGDGDAPETNLYWSTTPGFGEWFHERGWKRVLVQKAGETGDADILAVHVYRKSVAASAAWRKRGVPARFDIDIVARAWRGSAIDRALAAYAADVSGTTSRTLALSDGTTIAAGGAAQIVAYVGHNRLMDLEQFVWPAAGRTVKGTIAIACDTAPYMEAEVSAATRVPLLMTRDLLFANAAPLEATVLAFATGGDYAQMRRDATAAYAGVQKETFQHMAGVFTNPSDRRWKTR
jgi:hypothetical protein